MPLTPDEVNARTFQPTKFREGYDQAEVDDFLDEVVVELRRLNAENDELREKLSICEKRAAELSRASSSSAPKQTDRASVAELRPAAEPVAAPAPAPAPTPTPSPVPTPAPTPAAAKVADTAVGTAPASGTSGVQEAAGMLALAQRLHDEHVRTGERERDRLVGEAKAHSDRLVGEAEKKKNETLSALERERTGLERRIDQLREFERDYRSNLKSYLESQMQELDAQQSLLPGRPPHEAAAAHA
ncbi:MAG: cell division protein DivIVA [Micrococcales bacterium]|nr:MAG: cell division protein DivIVA [Micrococcales bacterium]PIE27320.1 MAG: cell division protein DivIVA [Micrococcales bacterium]